MRRHHARPVLIILAFAAAAACGPDTDADADTGTHELGPADGRDLAAVDTGRVAVGDTAPDFTLLSRTGERVTLSDLYRERNIILVFYRGHW